MPCVVQCVHGVCGLLNHPGAILLGCFHHFLERYAIYGCSFLCLDSFDVFFLLQGSLLLLLLLFFWVVAIEVLKVTSLELN